MPEIVFTRADGLILLTIGVVTGIFGVSFLGIVVAVVGGLMCLVGLAAGEN